MDKYVLKLYVTGRTVRSVRAEDNLRRVCESCLGGHYDVQVIDVLERPAVAEEQKILATPTVVKESPGPARRIIGDLSDADKVLRGLDLLPGDRPPCEPGQAGASRPGLASGLRREAE